MTAVVMNVPAQILARASTQPRAIALVEGDRRMTYEALSSDVLRAAKGMIAAGVGKGDRVALWAPNSNRWIIAALGAQASGAAIVPINTRYKSLEATYPVERTNASLLIAENGFMGIDAAAVAAAASGGDGDPVRLVDLSSAATGADSWTALVEAGSGLDDDIVLDRITSIDPNDLCDVMFTSGSTGRPKGVRHRHGPTVRQTFDTIAENGIVSEDRLLIVNPFFHVFGYTGGWMPGLLAGATVFPQPVFDVAKTLTLIERERITYFPGPPTIFTSILDDPRLAETDVSSLRFSLTGSADVPVELIQRMVDELTFERVVQAYGMTECGTATNTLATDSPTTIATTIGVASRDLEVRVVGPDNEPLGAGEPGEIVVRGYAVMDGYFDDAEATAAAIDTDGWLHTGDRGSCDDNGYFTILGRIKDMVIVGGFNVYPAEVEDMIREHPNVDDAAVIGVPDDRLGEVVCAFVVAREALEDNDFVSWCRERMANFKVPRHVRFVDAFPLTGSNKVSKVALRDMAKRDGLGVNSGS